MTSATAIATSATTALALTSATALALTSATAIALTSATAIATSAMPPAGEAFEAGNRCSSRRVSRSSVELPAFRVWV
jgi:hypothetical protein